MYNLEQQNQPKDNDSENETKEWKVYKHTCKANGLIYIGITAKSTEIRWRQGYKNNKELYKDILSYGRDGFSTEILEEHLTKTQAFVAEKFYIKTMQATNPKIGYNIRSGGTAPMYGKHHSEETKRKFSENRQGEKNNFYGRHHTEETKEILRQKNIGKKHTEEWKLQQSIRSKEWHKTHENPMKGNHCFAGENNPMYGKKGGLSPIARPVLQFDLENNFIQEFSSIIEASMYIHNSRANHISDCCNGKRNQWHGYKWKYKEENEEENA